MALVARVARLVTADLRLDDLLQRAADAIHELLGFPNLAIPLIDPEQPDTLVLTVKGGHYKRPDPGRVSHPDHARASWARPRGPGRTVLVNDVTADPRYLPTPGGAPARAELAVPILLGDRVLGVVNVERDEPFSRGGRDDRRHHRRPARGGDRERAALRQRAAGGGAGGAAAARARAARRGHPAPVQPHAHRPDARAGLRPEPRGGRGPRAPGGGAEPGGAGRDAGAAGRAAAATGARASGGRPRREERRRARRGRGSGTTGWRRRWRCWRRTSRATRLPVDAELGALRSRGRVAEEEALYRIAQEALSNVVKHAGATYAQLRLATDGADHGAEHHGRRHRASPRRSSGPASTRCRWAASACSPCASGRPRSAGRSGSTRRAAGGHHDRGRGAARTRSARA